MGRDSFEVLTNISTTLVDVVDSLNHIATLQTETRDFLTSTMNENIAHISAQIADGEMIQRDIRQLASNTYDLLNFNSDTAVMAFRTIPIPIR